MTYVYFKEKLLTVGLTEEQFSNSTDTPLPTIKGWSAKRTNKTPKWVDSYLKLYEENKQDKSIIKYLEGKIDDKN